VIYILLGVTAILFLTTTSYRFSGGFAIIILEECKNLTSHRELGCFHSFTDVSVNEDKLVVHMII
jgi:hypothetical protein